MNQKKTKPLWRRISSDVGKFIKDSLKISQREQIFLLAGFFVGTVGLTAALELGVCLAGIFLVVHIIDTLSRPRQPEEADALQGAILSPPALSPGTLSPEQKAALIAELQKDSRKQEALSLLSPT